MPAIEIPASAAAADCWLRALTAQPDPALAWEVTSDPLRADLYAAWLTEARTLDPTVPSVALAAAGGYPPFGYALVHLLVGLTDLVGIADWEVGWGWGWGTHPRPVALDLEVAVLVDRRNPAAGGHPFVMRHDTDRGWMVTALPTILQGVGEEVDISAAYG